MFSKALWGAVLASALAAGGCQFHVQTGLSTDSGAPMQMGGASTGSLAGSSVTLGDYFHGKASDASVKGVWDAASDSLAMFVDRTKGAQPGVYTADELKKFLERYFLKDTVIPDGLMTEAMELKRAVLGGSVDSLTVDEINRLRQILGVMRDQCLALQPYMPLTAEHVATMDDATVDRAADAVAQAAHELGKILQESGYPYFFARLDALLKEIDSFTDPVPGDAIQLLRARMPLVRALKGALISEGSDRIAGNEWATVLTTGARWLGLSLRGSQLNKAYPSWSTGAGRDRFVTVASDAVSLIDETIVRMGGTIRFEAFDAVIDALHAEELPARAQTIKNLLRPIIHDAFAEPASEGLTHTALLKGYRYLQQWSEGQRYLEALYDHVGRTMGRSGSPADGFVAADLLAPSIDEVFGKVQSSLGRVTVESAQRLHDTILRLPPLFLGTDGEITFGYHDTERRYSFSNLATLNWIQVVSRFLIDGYGHGKSALTADELNQAADDVRELGIELKYFDRNNPKVAYRRFAEANMFALTANGDDLLDFDETTQMFAFILSAKRLGDDRTHRTMEKACETYDGDQKKDDFDFILIDPNCYRREFFGHFEQYWDHLPGLAAFYRGLGPEERKAFEINFEKAARRDGYSDRMFDSTDSEAWAAIAQYVEALFSRFDTDRSGTISYPESKAAFPLVKKVLADKSGFKDDKDLEAVFTFLLAKGREPSKPDKRHPLKSLKAIAEYVAWREGKRFWRFEADRGTLIGIFAELGDSTPSSTGTAGDPSKP